MKRDEELEEELKGLRAIYSDINRERIRYKQALEFYADEEHYKNKQKNKQISKPLCETARKALESDEN